MTLPMSVTATWTPAEGWLLTYPSPLPEHAILAARKYVYEKRRGGLASMPPGPQRDQLAQAMDDIRTPSRVRFAVAAQNGAVSAFQSTERTTPTAYSFSGE